MSDKVTWKKLNSTSVQDFEAWVSGMEYEPYVYDPVLQSIDWVKDLTKAIKKVRYMLDEGADIEYLYWDKLRNWEFILNCFSIARVFGGITIADKKPNWKSTFEQFRCWVDSSLNHPHTRELYLSGTSFFYDMHQFFKDNRKLSDPKKLAKEVLAYKKQTILNKSCSTISLNSKSKGGCMNYQVICEQDIVNKLNSFAKEAKEKIWIATPYIGDFKTVSSVLGRNWRTKQYQKGIRFLVDVEERADYSALLEIKKFAEIRTLRGLHAKIYIFDGECIVSSANLTKTSLSKRYEVAVILKTDNNICDIFEKWWEKSKRITSKMLNKKTEKSLVGKEETTGGGLLNRWDMPKVQPIGKHAQRYFLFLNKLNEFKVNYQEAIGKKQLTKMPLFLEMDNFFDYLYHENGKPSLKHKDGNVRKIDKNRRAIEIKRHLDGYKKYLSSEKGKEAVKNIFQKITTLKKILQEDLTKESFWEILENCWTYSSLIRFGSNRIDENDIRTIKPAIYELLHEEDEMDHRIEKCSEQIKGIGKATISEILAFYDPDKYPVMNNNSESGLRYFGYNV